MGGEIYPRVSVAARALLLVGRGVRNGDRQLMGPQFALTNSSAALNDRGMWANTSEGGGNGDQTER